ncbi:defective in pollen organelle DNA degradation1 [Hibiscus trionum]|uniref:Defective in pollen organelle DNA degradation1 n=1 Tax=Hibiscus trionum TaxID=183268 RepID=A0A9W7M8S2_HIBTR|nr:defective in pollen organelle DNA degradation1 [Hibiscus trionum]
MRSVAICFSMLQAPRGRIFGLANFYWESFHNISRSRVNSLSFKPPAANYGIEGGYSRRWTRRPMTTRTDGRNKTNQAAKPSNLVRKTLDEKVSRSTALNINKTEEISEHQQLQNCCIQQMIAENKDLADLVTFIIYDTETSGFSRKDDRIIEIALQDLSGGENSTFQTLVNPGRYVANSHVHGITTNMVCRSDVPRMEELIPILMQFVKSRQKPGGYVLLGAHNSFAFDLPFLINEFSRCSYEIPPNWLFMDTLSLARELMKSGGSNLPSGMSLQALREHYRIPLVGSAHRAMSDVRTLAMILQMLTFDLKLSLPNLVTRSFTASEYANKRKKS